MNRQEIDQAIQTIASRLEETSSELNTPDVFKLCSVLKERTKLLDQWIELQRQHKTAK